MEEVFKWLGEMAHLLTGMYPVAGVVLSSVGVLVFIAQMVVLVTPSKKDDEKLSELMKKSWFAGMVGFFKSFAPFQKGSEGLEQSSESTK